MIKKTRERKKANTNTCNSIYSDIDCTYMIAAYKCFKRKINT